MRHWIKRILVSGLLLGLLGCAVLAGLNLWLCGRSGRYILSCEAAAGLEADCILVLGAGLWAPGEASPMLADRLDMAMQLWELGASDRLLMSGDHGREDYNEVEVMRDYALGRGAAPSAVFMDHAGFSTYESMVRAQEIFGCRKIVIVTQKYHLYRALYIARSLGLEAYGVAAEEISYPGWLWRESREVLARVKDIGCCLLRPDPTFLGEAIPIQGDGTASWDDAEAVLAGS